MITKFSPSLLQVSSEHRFPKCGNSIVSYTLYFGQTTNYKLHQTESRLASEYTATVSDSFIYNLY